MIIQYSSEIHAQIAASFLEVEGPASKILSTLVGSRDLASFDLTIGYVPIVMPADLIEDYPARSRFKTREKRVYYCCPQLEYDCYSSGSYQERVHAYVNGLSECSDVIATNASDKNLSRIFNSILIETAEILLKLSIPGPELN